MSEVDRTIRWVVVLLCCCGAGRVAASRCRRDERKLLMPAARPTELWRVQPLLEPARVSHISHSLSYMFASKAASHLHWTLSAQRKIPLNLGPTPSRPRLRIAIYAAHTAPGAAIISRETHISPKYQRAWGATNHDGPLFDTESGSRAERNASARGEVSYRGVKRVSYRAVSEARPLQSSLSERHPPSSSPPLRRAPYLWHWV